MPSFPYQKQKQGFTLIELSIVIVIIGLIVGGVMVGKDLIRASELRAVAREFDQFETSAQAFRLKYNCLAGDCSTASQMGLGSNGNGSGTIHNYSEGYLFWQHMGNSKLIAGDYTGTWSGAPWTGAPGINCPTSSIKGAGFSIGRYNPSAFLGWGPSIFKHYTYLGAPFNAEPPIASVLSAMDAKSVDLKIDDGLPYSGKLIGGAGYTDSNCVLSNEYAVATTTAAKCVIAKEMAF